MTDDGQIIRLFKAGQREEAFNQIVKNYGERLYWHIRRIVVVHEDADDLLQNTFAKAWSGLETFRGESGLYTWLYRIATNETLTFLSRKKLELANGDPEELSGRLAADKNFSGDSLQLTLQKAIATLPPKQRAVFCMRYYDETPYEQISKALGTSVGALKASYHHAYGKVLEYVKANVDIDF